MKQQHAVIVLFVLIVVSGLTSFGSYKMTDSRVSNDMKQALALTQRYEAEDASNILVKRQKADAQFFLKQYPEATETYEQLRSSACQTSGLPRCCGH